MTSTRTLSAVLAVLAVASLVLALAPDLDLAVSRLFWREGQGFWLSGYGLPQAVRRVSMYPTIACGIFALIAILAKIIWPWSKPLMPARMAVFFVVSMLASSIVLVNVVLKEHWERARPVHVQEFGGPWTFTPWWRPGDGSGCRTNCSFISGEASGAAWLVAPALVAPPPLRPAALAAAGIYALAISALRIAFGGHFLSDTLLAIFATLVIVVGCHYWFYRRWGAPNDDVIADRLAGLGLGLRRRFTRGRSS